METIVIYSSLTGNTKKVGEAIFEIIQGEKKLISIEEINSLILNNAKKIIIGFWVDKGTADARVRKLLKSIENKEVYFFGTLGADPDSDHGQKVFSKVSELCSKKNEFKGGFLCLGKVSDKLVNMMSKFPLKLVHPLTPERMARIENASSHPNLNDLKNAQEYFSNILKS